MKKRWVSLLLLAALLALLALPALADSERELPLVCDVCGILTETQADRLNERAEELSRQYGCDVIIVVVSDTGGYSVERFTEAVYREYRYGWGEDKSGVILLLSLGERDYNLAAYGYGNTAFTDHGKEWLMDEVKPYLRDNDYYGAFSKYLELCGDYLRQARDGQPVDRHGFGSRNHSGFRLSVPTVLWSAAAGLLIALLVTAVLKARMKSAVLQTKADNYLSGDLRLEYEDDRFLRKDVVRVRRNEGSGGGRGGTSVRSSGFSHHSGKF